MKYKIMILFLIVTCGIKLFPQNITDELEIRRNNFIDKGFGLEYNNNEIISYKLFLLRHNNYTKINEYDQGTENSDKEIEIEYDSIIVTFQTCKYGTIWGTKYNTILREIKSRNNANYLYGIKHGLTIDELENIIGKIELDKKYNSCWIQRNGTNHNIKIEFSEEKIKEIIWFIDWSEE